jgi:putative FmdB family regulatory protein
LPTYDYRCESCGHRYEKRESFSAPSRQKCPKCGKPASRILHAPPVVFKGGGFYKTDSRSGITTKSDDGDAPPASSDDSGSSDSSTTEAAAAG